jgi:hypothetical protein
MNNLFSCDSVVVHRLKSEKVVVILEQLHEVIKRVLVRLRIVFEHSLLSFNPDEIKVSRPLALLQLDEVVFFLSDHLTYFVFKSFLKLLPISEFQQVQQDVLEVLISFTTLIGENLLV